MKTLNARNTLLALTALGALTVYILACTSFSPDDQKVLYPAFDANGSVGISVYNRESKRSDLVFVPMPVNVESNKVAQPVVRAQWLGDGRRLLVSWADEQRMNLAVMPWGAQTPFRVFVMPGSDEPASRLMTPVPVARDKAFFIGESNEVTRLDLNTGATVRKQLADDDFELSLWPAGAEGLFYLEESRGNEAPHVFGRLNPDTFARTPALRFTNSLSDLLFFAYTPSGTRLAFVEQKKLVVVEDGRTVFVRPLEEGDSEMALCSGSFLPGGNMLVAGYQERYKSQTNSTFGIIEIPLNNNPPRKTPILEGVVCKEETSEYYFQIGVSHDGKTAAVATTYLACALEQVKPQNCALFFVDLSSAKRPVTRVSIPWPANGPVGLNK